MSRRASDNPATANRSITSSASIAPPITWRTAASMSRLSNVIGATAAIVGQSFANHRHHALEEGEVRRDGLGLRARNRQREGRRQFPDQRAQALPAVILPKDVIDRA